MSRWHSQGNNFEQFAFRSTDRSMLWKAPCRSTGRVLDQSADGCLACAVFPHQGLQFGSIQITFGADIDLVQHVGACCLGHLFVDRFQPGTGFLVGRDR
jgi:hypothetical protein